MGLLLGGVSLLQTLAPLVRLRRLGASVRRGDLMARLEVVEVNLANGHTMLARVHAGDPHERGPRDVGLREQLSFQGVTDALHHIASAMLNTLDHAKLERATVEFGLDLAVKAGKLTGLLVEGNSTATLKVTLEWARTSTLPVSTESRG